MDPFLEKVASTISAQRLLRRQRDSVLVAVSGGPDSVALLSALVELGRSRWRIGVLHVNHRLRGKAAERDEKFVMELARRLGVQAFVRRLRLAPGANLEERARRARQAACREVARRHGFRCVATAHTLDDQAETFFLRLLRGAGISGLAAIAPRRPDGWIRPLIECSKDEVLAYLERRGLPHRRDATNRDLRFARNRLRHRVLPLLERLFHPAVRRVIARTAAILREDAEWVERQARRRLKRLRRGIGLDAAALARLERPLARYVLRAWLEEETGSLRRIEAGHLDRLWGLARQGRGEVSLPGLRVGCEAGLLLCRNGRPAARKTYRRLLPEGRWVEAGGFRFRLARISGDRAGRPSPWRAVFDADAIGPGSFFVRSARAGDRLRPLGLDGTKKLQDVFVDAKVPRTARGSWPVVTHRGRVVWVPGLVRDETAPVGPTTRWTIEIEAEPVASVAAKNRLCYGASRFGHRPPRVGTRRDGRA
jgi:tRNA(Ile)-lysidine synthase